MPEDESCTDQRAELDALRAELRSLLRPARLLLVEDEEGDRASFLAFTKQYDVAIDMATTLKEALLMIVKTDYDLIIVDLKLPDGSGLDVFRSVTSHKLRSSVAIVSGFIDFDTATQVAEIGFAPLVMKPDCFTQEYFDRFMPTFGVHRKKSHAAI